MEGRAEERAGAAASPGAPAPVETGAKPYWSPYLAGVGLGLTLLASFLVMGRGFGASGAFTSAVTAAVHAVAPGHAEQNGLFAAYLGAPGKSPLSDWLVVLIVGVMIGGFVSARLAGRHAVEVLKGPRIGVRGRLILAFVGGALMGFAAKLAGGCTSSQALSGGALLSVGGWVFMLSLFAAGHAFARVFRRQWT